MRFITSLYFGSGLETELTNITTATAGVSLKTVFETFIGTKEVTYMEEFFGYELAKAIMAAYDASVAATPTPLPTIYDKIINGAEFTDQQGRLQKWKGLTRSDKISPIADYVYYKWRQKNVSTTVNEGETIAEVESNTQVGPADKMVSNWNHGVNENIILWNFLQANISDYPEFSLYGYDTFKRRTLLTRINTFDI